MKYHHSFTNKVPMVFQLDNSQLFKGAGYLDAEVLNISDMDDIFFKFTLDSDGLGFTIEARREDLDFLESFDMKVIFRKLAMAAEKQEMFSVNRDGSDHSHEDIRLVDLAKALSMNHEEDRHTKKPSIAMVL